MSVIKYNKWELLKGQQDIEMSWIVRDRDVHSTKHMDILNKVKLRISKYFLII